MEGLIGWLFVRSVSPMAALFLCWACLLLGYQIGRALRPGPYKGE